MEDKVINLRLAGVRDVYFAIIGCISQGANRAANRKQWHEVQDVLDRQ